MIAISRKREDFLAGEMTLWLWDLEVKELKKAYHNQKSVKAFDDKENVVGYLMLKEEPIEKDNGLWTLSFSFEEVSSPNQLVLEMYGFSLQGKPYGFVKPENKDFLFNGWAVMTDIIRYPLVVESVSLVNFDQQEHWLKIINTPLPKNKDKADETLRDICFNHGNKPILELLWRNS